MERLRSVGLGFLGVTTNSSSVHKILPLWGECVGAKLFLAPQDLALRSDAASYRKYISDLHDDYPHLLGALITSHKASVFENAADLFDVVTPASARLCEVGMVYWRNGKFVADTNDAISSLQAVQLLLRSSKSWQPGSRSVVIMGAGGAGLALANAFTTNTGLGCSNITLTDTSPWRFAIVKERLLEWDSSVPIQIIQVDENSDNIVAGAGEGSLIVNATGLGKDQPGSPVSEKVTFPAHAIIWEFNYRYVSQPTPTFMEIAKRQAQSRDLILKDGWDYFVRGWLVVIASVLGLPPGNFYPCFRKAADYVRYKSESQTEL